MEKQFWNQRYADPDLIYGEAPNDFVALKVTRATPGSRALDLAAGEGRNALYLARLGFDTLAVDQSEVGLAKAARLAKERGLTLRTQAADLNEFEGEANAFDVITSTFVHLPTSIRSRVHRGISRWLRPGGVYVLEAYGPDQIHRDTGGPKDPALLAPLETIVEELSAGAGGGGGGGGGGGLMIEHQASLVRDVVEGKFHGGPASVVQVVARKG